MGSIAGDLPQSIEDRHEQVEASCKALERLAKYLPHWGMNKPAREVARSLCAYFERELQRHRDQQESYLFPALLYRADRDELTDMYETIARSMAEHREIDYAWKELRSVLADIALCRPRVLSSSLVAHFIDLYRDHLIGEQDRLMCLLKELARGRIRHDDATLRNSRALHIQRVDRLYLAAQSFPALRRFAAG